jgi:stalled ribosome rescue protein Dom34
MHNYYGIWIDHREAFIVKASKMGEMEVKHVSSEVEAHNHGGESQEHLTLANQRSNSEHRHNEMKAFSRDILSHLTDADEIVIFGPGQAKHDLKHELEAHKALAEKLKSLETTDALTEAQLKAFVRDYFKLAR